MTRLKYFVKKIRIAQKKKVLRKKLSLFVKNMIQQYFITPLIYVAETKWKIDKLGIDCYGGFKNHRSEADFKSISNRNILRIIKAYKLAKEHQRNVKSEFEIKGLWNEWISINYQM